MMISLPRIFSTGTYLLASLATASLAGCDDSSGAGGTGGSGSGGSGGGDSSTTTTTPPCADSGVHVVIDVIHPDGQALDLEEADVAGTVTGAGVDTPPSNACGAGQAWVAFDADDGSGGWLACFQMPNLNLTLASGDPIELTRTLDSHDIAIASKHTTLRSNGELVLHVESITFSGDLALPEGIAVGDGELLCESPGVAGCGTRSHVALVSLGDDSVEVTPGESGVVGGYRVHVDHYDEVTSDGTCDEGNNWYLIGILPESLE